VFSRITLSIQKATTSAEELPSRQSCRRWIQCALQTAQEMLPSTRRPPVDPAKSVELTLRFVDEAESAALNQQYRHKTGSTNILSFSCENIPEDTTHYLGDLVICVPLVFQEAREQGKQSIAHWAHLVLHGVLHLLGYDHIQEEEAVVMEGLEIKALEKLGYANPYLI
jgi:probable rRNA maturation factor